MWLRALPDRMSPFAGRDLAEQQPRPPDTQALAGVGTSCRRIMQPLSIPEHHVVPVLMVERRDLHDRPVPCQQSRKHRLHLAVLPEVAHHVVPTLLEAYAIKDPGRVGSRLHAISGDAAEEASSSGLQSLVVADACSHRRTAQEAISLVVLLIVMPAFP